MAATIVFGSDQYDKLITHVGSLITDLQNLTSTGPAPLSANLLLQPDGQTWQPAVDLVAAGKAFFEPERALLTDTILPQLTTLQHGLSAARSIFSNAEDLATASSAEFLKEFQT
jgi:hypothetical protein